MDQEKYQQEEDKYYDNLYKEYEDKEWGRLEALYGSK